MTIRLEPKDLLAYKNRDWDRVRESKERYWAEDARAGGPEAGLQVSETLWAHVRMVDLSWPTPSERQADLEHHIRLASQLRHLAHVFRRP